MHAAPTFDERVRFQSHTIIMNTFNFLLSTFNFMHTKFTVNSIGTIISRMCSDQCRFFSQQLAKGNTHNHTAFNLRLCTTKMHRKCDRNIFIGSFKDTRVKQLMQRALFSIVAKQNLDQVYRARAIK